MCRPEEGLRAEALEGHRHLSVEGLTAGPCVLQ